MAIVIRNPPNKPVHHFGFNQMQVETDVLGRVRNSLMAEQEEGKEVSELKVLKCFNILEARDTGILTPDFFMYVFFRWLFSMMTIVSWIWEIIKWLKQNMTFSSNFDPTKYLFTSKMNWKLHYSLRWDIFTILIWCTYFSIIPMVYN